MLTQHHSANNLHIFANSINCVAHLYINLHTFMSWVICKPLTTKYCAFNLKEIHFIIKELVSNWCLINSLFSKIHYMPKVCADEAKCWSKGLCRNNDQTANTVNGLIGTNSCANKDRTPLKTVNSFQEGFDRLWGWNHVVELGESRDFVTGCTFS